MGTDKGNVVTTQATALAETFKVGPDLVTLTEHQVIIDARHEMPDWQVREYSRIPIYFREGKYFLRQKMPGTRPYATRYVLEHWPQDYHQPVTSTLSYDEETVAERESALRTGHMENVVHGALLIVYPFVGLLWSKSKEKLIRFGIVPRSATGVSIFVVFALMFLQAYFFKMLMFGSLRSGKVAVGGMIRAFTDLDSLNMGFCAIPIWSLDVALFVVLLLDCILRYNRYLRAEEDSPWGFMEWLTCLLPRNKTSTVDEPEKEPVS